MLKKYLDDLEARINPELENELFNQWKRFWNNETNEEVFFPKRKEAIPSSIEWPVINFNDAINDPSFETMLLSQLCKVNAFLSSGNGLHLAIRPDYGSSIMPSLFGAQVYMMDREYNTLPGAFAVEGGTETIKKLVKSGIPDLDGGQGKQVMDCTEFFIEQLKSYPKLNKYCRIYPPDLQGAFDICEVVWGSNIFLDMYDSPQLVKDFMQLITDSYIAYASRWFELVPPSDDLNVHRGWVHKGKIRLCLDSCMNISPEDYEEFVKPYDTQMLDKFGGMIHSCGKIDHIAPCLTDIPKYYGFNMGQPEYNDMETIYKATVDHGIKIINLPGRIASEAVKSGRNLQKNVMRRLLV